MHPKSNCSWKCILIKSKRDMGKLERVQERTTKVMMALEHLPYKKNSWDCCGYLAQSRLKEGLTTMNKYLKGRCKEKRTRLPSLVPVKGPEAMAQTETLKAPSKHQGRPFQSECDWALTQVAQWCNEISALEDIESHLDMFLLERGVGQLISRSPFQA